jgi:branched-chain amino acid transport system substrate-binding protein
VTATAFNGNYYTYDYWGKFLKSIGVTKLGGLSYSISPSSQHSVDTTLASAAKHGISSCYNNKTVPFGGVDFTADALSIKAAGCNGVTVALVDSSDIAVAQAIKNGGISAKTIIGGTGYDNTVLSSPSAAAALDGQYMDTQIDFTPPNPATQAMLDALKKYDTQYKGGLPDYGTYVAYVSTDLMIKGLELAGENPTRSAFISKLHKVTSYDAEGILPGSVSFSLKNFGTVAMLPKTYCNYFVQLKNDKYTTTNSNKPWCGSLVAGGS